MARWQTWTAALALGLTVASSPGWASPPHWAPAHGYRRHTRVVAYQPGPFVYRGYTYLPLRDVTSLLGVTLVWNSPEGHAVLSYNGRSFGLFIGNTTFFFGDERVLLPAPPILVEQVVYVPVVFVERYMRVPVEHSSHWVKLRGPRGWHEYTVLSRAPGRIDAHYRAPRAARFAPARPAVRTRERQTFRTPERARGHEPTRPAARPHERGAARPEGWKASPPRARERAWGEARPASPRATGRRERGQPGREASPRGESRPHGEKGRGEAGRGRGEGQGHGRGHDR